MFAVKSELNIYIDSYCICCNMLYTNFILSWGPNVTPHLWSVSCAVKPSPCWQVPPFLAHPKQHFWSLPNNREWCNRHHRWLVTFKALVIFLGPTWSAAHQVGRAVRIRKCLIIHWNISYIYISYNSYITGNCHRSSTYMRNPVEWRSNFHSLGHPWRSVKTSEIVKSTDGPSQKNLKRLKQWEPVGRKSMRSPNKSKEEHKLSLFILFCGAKGTLSNQTRTQNWLCQLVSATRMVHMAVKIWITKWIKCWKNAQFLHMATCVHRSTIHW